MFPGCAYLQTGDGGLPLLVLAHIDGLNPGAPRFREDSEQAAESNLIVLCANHHRLIDTEPERYTAEWLRAAKVKRETEIGWHAPNASSEIVRLPVASDARNPLSEAMKQWGQYRHTASEDFWQHLFEERPGCLATMLQGRAYRLHSKYYVGGKNWDNKGGNELDFLAENSGRLACIEIKTPEVSSRGVSTEETYTFQAET